MSVPQWLARILFAPAFLTPIVLASVGCTPAAKPPPPGDSAECALRIEVDVIATRIARARKLPFERPLEVHVLEPKSFAARAHEEDPQAPSPDAALRLEAIRIAFGTMDDDAWGTSKEMEVDGFYSPKRKALFLRDDIDEREGMDVMRRSFAHEIVHALQDQHFDLGAAVARWDELDRDAALAWRGVVEGDAVVTSYLWNSLGGDAGEEKVVSAVGLQMAIRAATTFDDTRAAYYAGGGFVAAVHRSAGFAAIDALFRDPPSSAEQLFHPEKYATGEQPVPIASLPEPEGWDGIAGGVFGEVRTRAILRQCLPMFVARETAARWAGDRYAVVTKDKRVGALWVSTWDDEDAASAFVRRLDAQDRCRRAPSVGDRFEVHPVVSIVQFGKDVVFARGLESWEWSADTMLATIGQRPARTPRNFPRGLSGWDIAYDPAALLSGKRFAGVGVTAVVPEGFEASVGEPNASLVIARPGLYPHAGATLRMVAAKEWARNPDAWPWLSTMFPADEWTLTKPIDGATTLAGHSWRTKTRKLVRDGSSIGTWTTATVVVMDTRFVVETFTRSAEDETALAPFLVSIALP